jgi:hypothetical protein
MYLELPDFTWGHPVQQIGIRGLFRVSGARLKNAHDSAIIARIHQLPQGHEVLGMKYWNSLT